jgi:dTDP-4-amino-4,6-dideoxygalactose transaminase
MIIPFNKPHLTGLEEYYLKKAINNKHFSGKGEFTKKCNLLLKKELKVLETLLVPSGTAALDMAAILLDLKKGDEVILPSFTFPSTANAFCLRGAKPVFLDINEDDLNMDHSKLETAITKKTKAIFNVNYGGVSSNLDILMDIASNNNLYLVEDAAQGLGSYYKNRPIGSLGDLSALSFHDTKNIFCGEGGALLINRPEFIERANFIQEMGTDRALMREGKRKKYSWVDIGSSYLLSDLLAAFLYPQLLNIKKITTKRKKIYLKYKEVFNPFVEAGFIKIQKIPKYCQSNFHTFYLLFKTQEKRNIFISEMKKSGITTSGHYFPLHGSKMGESFGYQMKDLPITFSVYNKMVRLPIWPDMTNFQIEYVCDKASKILGKFYFHKIKKMTK